MEIFIAISKGHIQPDIKDVVNSNEMLKEWCTLLIHQISNTNMDLSIIYNRWSKLIDYTKKPQTQRLHYRIEFDYWQTQCLRVTKPPLLLQNKNLKTKKKNSNTEHVSLMRTKIFKPIYKKKSHHHDKRTRTMSGPQYMPREKTHRKKIHFVLRTLSTTTDPTMMMPPTRTE